MKRLSILKQSITFGVSKMSDSEPKHSSMYGSRLPIDFSFGEKEAINELLSLKTSCRLSTLIKESEETMKQRDLCMIDTNFPMNDLEYQIEVTDQIKIESQKSSKVIGCTPKFENSDSDSIGSPLSENPFKPLAPKNSKVI
jgi:hypothetical protein